MDSGMPWTITRNFVRAFASTLVAVILWDLGRNLSHLSAMTWWAVMSDTAALGVVIAIRLAPPRAGLRAQLKGFLRWKSEALFAGLILLLVLLFHPPQFTLLGIFPRFILEILPGLAACVFYADLARVCKIEYETSRKTIRALCIAYGVIVALFSEMASSVAQIRQGTFPWRDSIYFMVFAMIVLSVFALQVWGQGSERFPVVQELGLNRQGPS